MDQNALREEHRQGGYQIRTVHQHAATIPLTVIPQIDSTTEKKYDSYRATELHRVLPFGHKLNPLKTGA
jgi:hypothetical protein